jgi:hypothetical protein
MFGSGRTRAMCEVIAADGLRHTKNGNGITAIVFRLLLRLIYSVSVRTVG